MIHKYLFYIDDLKIRTFCSRNGVFELIRREGEEFSNISDKLFWSWWEETASYNKLKDETDFCIISNSECDRSYLEYKTIHGTMWTMGEIENFYNEHIEYSRIVLEFDLRKSSRLTKGKKYFSDNSERQFQVTLCSGSIFKDHSSNRVLDSISETDIRRYYQGKIANEKSR